MKRETNPISNNWAVGNQVSKERKKALESQSERREWEKGKKVQAVKVEGGIRLTKLIYI